MIDEKNLFDALVGAPHEGAVSEVLECFGLTRNRDVWKPYGDNSSNYGVVDNQQAHAVPALVEKITNGIDAILERRCLEEGIDPESPDAPRSISEAIERFFPNYKNWDIQDIRRKQAHDLQIVADGPKNNTSLLIYDNGVGQNPEEFPNTFMSLIRGNKNAVHFVQGRYNMGGAGAVVFCGHSRFQLVASRRFGGSKRVGFTLLRRHPLTRDEEQNIRSTWYEYLFIDGAVPSFEADSIDIGLNGRFFSSGSFLKLYSYRLPPGTRMIQRDLNLSLNEYLFQPALPFLTVEKAERYPDNKTLATPVVGLHRRLEEDNETVEERFTLTSTTNKLGKLNVQVYIFKARAREKNAKESKSYIRNEYFKNNMSVPFSVNGQVQGSFTTEFITRTLKMQLLKDYLLIHVDCSELRNEVRNEIFMASRDRLKRGDESNELRNHLCDILLKDGRLKEAEKRRRSSFGSDSADTTELVKNIARKTSINPEMAKLLKQAIEIPDTRHGGSGKNKSGEHRPKTTAVPRSSARDKSAFESKRYPSVFKLQGGDGQENDMTMFRIPRGGHRTIKFSTDVEDQYFDRAEDAGEMQIDILRPGGEGERGGDGEADLGRRDHTFDVIKSSPSSGQIRIDLSASKDLSVGDAAKIRVSLSGANEPLVETFMVRVSDAKPEKPAPTPREPEPILGLPEVIQVSQKGGDGRKSWDEIEGAGNTFTHNTVVMPILDGDKLASIAINMDSHAFMSYRAKLKTEEQYNFAEQRYISAVYLHCLFIFTTMSGRGYILTRENDREEKDVSICEYIADLFERSYAQFLLTFDTSDIMDAIG